VAKEAVGGDLWSKEPRHRQKCDTANVRLWEEPARLVFHITEVLPQAESCELCPSSLNPHSNCGHQTEQQTHRKPKGRSCSCTNSRAKQHHPGQLAIERWIV
jgi:hypothetical protein